MYIYVFCCVRYILNVVKLPFKSKQEMDEPVFSVIKHCILLQSSEG